MMREGFRSIQVGQAIPASAEFYTAYFDNERNAFVCVFEDAVFQPVPDGCVIPLSPGPQVEEIDTDDEPDGWRTELAPVVKEGDEIAPNCFVIRARDLTNDAFTFPHMESTPA